MDKPVPLPLTKDAEELERAMLDQLDLVAKRVERLTGFAVRRHDPASADFLMSLYAGQLLWNDINHRVSVLFGQSVASQNGLLRQYSAAVDELQQATREMQQARDEVNQAREALRNEARAVASLFLEQVTKTEDQRGTKTLLGLMTHAVKRLEERTSKLEGNVVGMLEEAAVTAASRAERDAIDGIGQAVAVQLQVHGANAVLGINASAERVAAAAQRLEVTASAMQSQVDHPFSTQRLTYGPARKAWVWLEHTIGVGPMVVIAIVLGAALFVAAS